MVVGSDAWRTLSPADLAREYSPSSAVDSIDVELGRYALASEQVRANAAHVEHRYGPRDRQRLDVFCPPGQTSSPALIFIHGGYWQAETKERACGAAADVVASGAAFIAIEYTLCPEATLDEIVEECRTAIEWLVRHAAECGIDPNRLHIAGSSAGAHLAALMVLTNWTARGITAEPFRSATLLSGVFDLRPLVETYVNDPIGLDDRSAWALSPMAHLASSPVAVVVAWGEHETAEFGRQGWAFARAWRELGNRCDVLPDVLHRNHFDLPLDLGAARSSLGQAVMAHLRGGEHDD